ncbi:MAG: hypothetical protein NZ699_13235 [Roseiflexus sp.]|nr:hypothetical protein [Roseiflexus sp.]MDW8148530.1 hypothetical protein [Roseiflexaceae bacterium]
MSGGLKSGLIFAVVSVVAVIGLSFIPFIGFFCCGPLASMALGAIAGYIGIRWSDPTAGVGSGALAGGVAGIGAFVGSVLYTVIILILLQSDPALFEQLIESQLAGQPLPPGLTMDDMRSFVAIGIPILGFCAGLIHLLFAALLGALGGWLAVRQRPQPMPPAYPAA